MCVCVCVYHHHFQGLETLQISAGKKVIDDAALECAKRFYYKRYVLKLFFISPASPLFYLFVCDGEQYIRIVC